jgi:hypothetical protein
MNAINDQVGAALSMTFVTGQPIVFVGTGQVGHPFFHMATRIQRNITDLYGFKTAARGERCAGHFK